MSERRLIAFSRRGAHRLDAGGVPPMELKHIHPPHASADKRAELLRDKHRACLMRIAAQRSRQAQREKKGA